MHPGAQTQAPWVAGGEAAVMCQSLSPQLPEPHERGCFLGCRSRQPRPLPPPSRWLHSRLHSGPALDICLLAGTQSRRAGVCPCAHLRAAGTCFHTPAPTRGAPHPPPATCAVPEPAPVQATSFMLTRKAGAIWSLTRRSVHRSLLCSVPRCPSPGDKSLILLAPLW